MLSVYGCLSVNLLGIITRMPRLTRYCPPNVPVHIIQRGNNRNVIFTCDRDRAAYAHWLREGADKARVKVHGWVLMTNHVHLLLTPSTDHGVSRLMHLLGLQYARFFNREYHRSGTLFEGRFRASLVQDDLYFLTCLRYIELNPVRAGMVSDPSGFRWSSYGCHVDGLSAAMWSPHATYLALGDSPLARQSCYRTLIRQALSSDDVAKVRDCVNSGRILGSATFKAQIERLKG